jgi:serine incorporator 1/3
LPYFNPPPFFFFFISPPLTAWLARIASPLFLGIQMLIIIDMANSWNEAWVAEGEEDPRYLYALLGATIFSYAVSFTTAGLAFRWFAPGSHDCSLNITLITLTLLVVIVLTAITLHPRIKQVNPSASIFVSSCTALYCSYLSFAALQSEPRDYECNTLGQKLSAASGTTLAAGMLITLVSTVWAAFRAGSNTRTFGTGWEESSGRHQPLLDEELTSAGLDGVTNTSAPQSMSTMNRTSAGGGGGGNGGVGAPGTAMADFVPVSYSYLQFYLVFALASMYLAMLMTGWGSGGEQKDQIDVGWTSVWVKTISSWAAAGLYCWTLLAPALFPDREFSF